MRALAIACLAFSAAPAFAQEAPLDKVYACSAIADGTQRLACYDGAVAGLKQAQASGGVAVVSREQVAAAEKEAFGFDAPKLAELARNAAAPPPVVTAPPAAGAPAKPVTPAAAPAPQPLDKVMLTIKSAEKLPNGTYRFTMDNGQVWQQTDTVDLGRLPKGTMTAEIKKAAMGSFMLKPGDRTAVRAKRLQ